MSSNIKIQKFCEYCGNEFTAKTTVTRYCSDVCSKRAYKARKRAEKINNAKLEVIAPKQKPIEDLSKKEYLTVKEVSMLLNCSVRSVYYYIDSGLIPAKNLGVRLTRIKRTNIDNLFLKEIAPPKQYTIEECYTITEVQDKFNISQTALQNIIKREEIPKIKKGKFVYVPKELIKEVFS